MSFIDQILEEGLTAFGKIQLQVSPPKVTAADCRAIMARAKPGMVVCRKFNSYLDGRFIPGEFTHSGIVETPDMMIHAVAEGVGRIDILDFVKDADGFILLSPSAGHYKPEDAVNYARQQIGKPYDFKFNVENGPVTAFFCHELSAMSIAAGGIKISPIIKYVGAVAHEVYLADQFILDPRITTVYRTHIRELILPN